MAQLIRLNRCAAELPQRATLINLPGGGRRQLTNLHLVSLPIICAELFLRKDC